MNFDCDFIHEEHCRLQAFSSNTFHFNMNSENAVPPQEKHILILPLQKKCEDKFSKKHISQNSKNINLRKVGAMKMTRRFSMKIKYLNHKKLKKLYEPPSLKSEKPKEKEKNTDILVEFTYQKVSELINEKIKGAHVNKFEDNEDATAYYLHKVNS